MTPPTPEPPAVTAAWNELIERFCWWLSQQPDLVQPTQPTITGE